MKHYTLRVTETKARFVEELFKSLQFIDFREVTPEEVTHAHGATAHTSIKNVAERVKASRQQDLVKLKEIMGMIDQKRNG